MGDFKEFMIDKGLGDCELDLHLYMRMAWNEAKAIYKPKWISVNDRLPQDDKRYLCKTEYSKETILFTRSRFQTVSNVTHYMEIPE